MKNYGNETLGELLLGCLYYYGLLFLIVWPIAMPIIFALHGVCEAICEPAEDDGDA